MEDNKKAKLEESDSSSSSDEELTEEQQREKFRQKIANMDLATLKRMSSKLSHRIKSTKELPKTQFKRANKNRPREMSSRVSAEVVNLKRKFNTSEPPKNQPPRDPRFDPLCGSFDNKIFKSNYKFVNDLRKKEKHILETELKEVTDPNRKKSIKFVMQRLDNQIREEERNEKEGQKVLEEKQHIREQISRGEKPVFKKKSEKKLEDLIKKYENLKEGNKLQKHIEKRSKKLAGKEKKKLTKLNLLA